MNNEFEVWKKKLIDMLDNNSPLFKHKWVFHENHTVTIPNDRAMIHGILWAIFIFIVAMFINGTDASVLYDTIKNTPTILVGVIIITIIIYFLYNKKITLTFSDAKKGEPEIDTITYKCNSKHGDYNINVKTMKWTVYTILNVSNKTQAEIFILHLKKYIHMKDPEKMETGQFSN